MARVDAFQCPSCSCWVVIPPLETTDNRAKHCNNPICNADFSFTNNELLQFEVEDDVSRRGYFTSAEARRR
jgi:hypothetical protein